MADVRALLFDLDGTLVDTGEANFAAYAAAFAEVGVEVTRDAFEAEAFGRNWRQFVPRFLDRAGIAADPAAIAARKRALYPDHVAALRVHHGLIALARASRPAMATGLVTTASAASVASILNCHRFGDAFDTIVTGNDVARHKPDPEAYLLAAARLDVAAGACLVFEDSAIGLASARAAGMAVVQVTMTEAAPAR